jgi:hypothetical protein
MRSMRLTAACAVLLALLVAHGAEHSLRHDTSAPAELAAVGLAGMVITFAVLVLALAGVRGAGPAAVLLGVGTALGLVAAHLAPLWSSAFSYPYPALGLDALSWASMLAALAAALWVAFEGARARPQSSRPPRTAAAQGQA